MSALLFAFVAQLMHQKMMLQTDIPEQKGQLTADTAEMQILLAVPYHVMLWKRGLRNLKG